MPTAQARVYLLGTDVLGVITGVTVGTSQPIRAADQNQLSFYFASQGTTSGGTILIEEADYGGEDAPYSGTWSVITTVSASTFTGGAQFAYHSTAPAAFGFIRVRISAAITGGGTITAVLRMR